MKAHIKQKHHNGKYTFDPEMITSKHRCLIDFSLFFRLVMYQWGGSNQPGRIDFILHPFHTRQSDRMGVHERIFNATMRQTGSMIPRQHIVTALQNGLRRALSNLVRDIPDNDSVYVSMGSNRLARNYEMWGLRADDLKEGGVRVDAMLDRFGRMLNSNQEFQMDDSFHVSFTHVLGEPRGRGRKRKSKPGHQFPEIRKKLKRCEVEIDNSDDNLCCARAIVTAKARVDKHPNWRSFRDGYSIQYEAAVQLHNEANIPPGPCGYEELVKFAAVPSLYEYQLLVVDATRQFTVTSYGPPQGKQLVLLYENDHYSVVTSLPAFFGTSYVCPYCFLGYNNEGKHQLQVNKTHCKGCQQNGCSDYMEARARNQPPSLKCNDCHRYFYGLTCFNHRKTMTQDNKLVSPEKPLSVCQYRRKCPECLKLLISDKVQTKHQCGYINCPSCNRYVPTADHQCFIQKDRMKSKKKKTSLEGAAAGRQTLIGNTGEDILDDDEKNYRFTSSLI